MYKNVFNLPDVEYAVEVMLHGIDDEDVKKYKYDNELYANHIILNDGRKFELDKPGELTAFFLSSLFVFWRHFVMFVKFQKKQCAS